jgi:hypothetical protein
MIFKPKCTKCASIGSVTNLCGPGAERFKLRKKLGTKLHPGLKQESWVHFSIWIT